MYATDASRRSAISVKDLLCPSASIDNLLSSPAAEPSQHCPAPSTSVSYPPATASQPPRTPDRNTCSSPPLPSTPTSHSLSSILSSPPSPSTSKKPTRGPWRLEEDRLLIDLVRRYGACHWSAIAAFLPRRSGKQARERWINQLNPALKKKNWTAKEDRVILHAHAVLGNKWSAIAQMLPGRTDNSVKNRFNSTLKRAMRERARTMDSSRVAAGALQREASGSVSVSVDEVVESLHAKPFGYQRGIASDIVTVCETERLCGTGSLLAGGEAGRLFTPIAEHMPNATQALNAGKASWDGQCSLVSEYEKYGHA